MKNLLLYAVYGGYRKLCKANSNIFRRFLQYQRLPVICQSEIRGKNELSSTRQLQNGSQGVRAYSTDAQPKKMKLMEFEWIVWPSLIKTVKNWVFTSLIIKPYFDAEFSLPDFVNGSKQALEIVSKRVSVGEFENLQGLVTEDCLSEVQKNVTSLSLAQRQELSINPQDVYFAFPYEVGVMFDDTAGSGKDNGKQKRAVEITMVYHVLRGYKEILERGETVPINMGVLPEYRDKIFICNYRFVRDYTKGVSDQWTVNIINHFKPSEYAES